MSELAAITPADGADALALLRCMGLAVCEKEGRLVVSGLAELEPEDRVSATAWAKGWKQGILHCLQLEAMTPAERRARDVAERKAFWPLRRRYMSMEQIKNALAAHGLRAVRSGNDFFMADAERIPFEMLPGVITFLRCNTRIILRHLDALEDQ